MRSRKTGKQRLLQALCQHRCLTTTQCIEIGLGNSQMVRRYLRQLESDRLINVSPWQLGADIGRPENMAVPTQTALDATGIGSSPIKKRALAHEYNLNWCRIRFSRLDSETVGLQFSERADLSFALPGKKVIPDMTFTLTSQTLRKRLLFFVEMDMGTESLASPKKKSGDLREKLESYRQLRLSDAYQSIWEGTPATRGFRVLLVLASKPRFLQALRLCQQMRPCPFVWCAGFETLNSQGAGSRIWHRGGDASLTHSILGSLENAYLAHSQQNLSAAQSV